MNRDMPQEAVLEVVEGRILFNGIDVTWNDRALARLMRQWAKQIVEEETKDAETKSTE